MARAAASGESLARKAMGVAFLALLGLAGWLTYACYTQAFVDSVPVTVHAGRIGLALEPLADVTMRGVPVGEVQGLTPAPHGGALVELAMDPERIEEIPADVNATILPTTVFGQQHVALRAPRTPSTESLSAGDVITRAHVPTEVQQVVTDVYPLLRAVRPADLSATLNAMSTSLEGRGERLGDNLVRLDGYLQQLNPLVPGLIQDLQLLTTVSDNYAEVLPELGRFLRNQATTGDTLVEKEQELRALFTDVAGLSNTARDFLEVNEDNIIRLGEVSAPTVRLLQRYSPEYPCLLRGIARQTPRLDQVFRNHTVQITVETLPHQPTGYTPADDPEYGAAYGPTCATLPAPPYSQANPAPLPPFLKNEEGDDGIEGSHGKYRTPPTYRASHAVTTGWAGTAAEQRVVASVAAPALGIPVGEVPDVTTLLLGPIARGNELSIRQR